VSTEVPTPEGASASDAERLRALEERVDRLSGTVEALEEELLLAGDAAEDIERFMISGFFDLTFAKYLPDDDAWLKGLVEESSFFTMQNLNLKPVTILVIKVEAVRTAFPTSGAGGLWALGAQAAVSF
jgi:hypothetical protein